MQPYLSKGGTHVIVETRHPDHTDQHHTPLEDWTGGPYLQERPMEIDAREQQPQPSQVGEHISHPEGRRPYVEVYEDVAGNWRYRVVGANGEIVAASEPYVSKSNATRGFADLFRIVNEVAAHA